MNYLAGPLTRAQIPALNRLAESAGAQRQPPPAMNRPPSRKKRPLPRRSRPRGCWRRSTGIPRTRPAAPAHLDEYFLTADLESSQSARFQWTWTPPPPITPEGLLYRPALLSQAQVRYLSARQEWIYTRLEAALLTELEGSLLRWEEHAWRVYTAGELQSQPLPLARFAALPGWLSDPKRLAALQRSFID